MAQTKPTGTVRTAAAGLLDYAAVAVYWLRQKLEPVVRGGTSGPDRLTPPQLKALAEMRLREARALKNMGFDDGAFYIAGYVTELALKAVICKHLGLASYPPSGRDLGKKFKTHSYRELLVFAGLEQEQKRIAAANPVFKVTWSIVSDWSENSRYHPLTHHKAKDVEDLLDALDDPQDGVLAWLKKNW